MRNANSGRYLDVPNSNTVDGTDLIQYNLKGGANQRFYLIYNASTRDYSLFPVCAPSSAIEVTNTAPDNYAVVQIWTKPSSGVMNSQRFNIVKNGDGSYRLLSYASKYTRAVVVYAASQDNGATIVQYTDNGSSNGFWFFEPANKTIKTGTLENRNYNRRNAAAYAITYAESPNPAYENLVASGGDCTNFVSQCLYAGGMSKIPNTVVWAVTSRTDTENWFYLSGPLNDYKSDWVSHTFASASAFNLHWGQVNHRAYQTVQYNSGTSSKPGC